MEAVRAGATLSEKRVEQVGPRRKDPEGPRLGHSRRKGSKHPSRRVRVVLRDRGLPRKKGRGSEASPVPGRGEPAAERAAVIPSRRWVEASLVPLVDLAEAREEVLPAGVLADALVRLAEVVALSQDPPQPRLLHQMQAQVRPV
jgi:hypothetical protein